MRAEGSNGSVEIVGDRIVIRRKGLANIVTQGIQGDKSIPLSRITAVQFRSAGSLMAGLIQFTIEGGREFRGGMMEATKDENAVLFTREQEPAFVELHDIVQQRISSGSLSTQSNRSDIDDLAKVVEIFEKGYLTQDEFNERKRSILSSSGTTHSLPTPKPTQLQVSSYPAIETQGIVKQRKMPWWGWVIIFFVVIRLMANLPIPV